MSMELNHPSLPELHFPRYQELPDYGLYLEQVLGIVNDVLSEICVEPISKAMINNWIKLKALSSPVKKKYYRDHICYLFALGSLKQVFTVQQIGTFFNIQRDTYPIEDAYNFFCTEYENAVKEAFCFTGNALPVVETKRTEQTILMRSMVLAAANRIYVDKCLGIF